MKRSFGWLALIGICCGAICCAQKEPQKDVQRETQKEPQRETDPVAALQPLLEKMEKEGTTIRVTDFSEPNQWFKRKDLATKIEYDVKKTDSMVSPYVAEISWIPVRYKSDDFNTKEEAEKAGLPARPIITGNIWHTELAFQNGKWVVKEIWWVLELPPFTRIERRHSTLETDKDPIQDWWWLLGGK